MFPGQLQVLVKN